MATQTMAVDDRVMHARTGWMARFIAGGVPISDFIEVTNNIVRDVNNIGIVGPGPASMGVRIAKTDLGNIPSRMYNSPDGKTPGISRPVTFYWKSEKNRAPQSLSIQ